MPNMIFIQPKAKLFGQNPLTKNIFSSEKLTTYCKKKIKKLPFVTINGVGGQTDEGCNNVTQFFSRDSDLTTSVVRP